MTITEFIAAQAPERQGLLIKIHILIIEEDISVDAAVGKMMGQEMILYNSPGTFKYGLASPQKYMSLHALPLYAVPAIHAKYKELLPNAAFQKGCINFTDETQVPLEILRMLIADCAKIDLAALREEHLKSRKK
jgi:hypothetical protein